MHALRLEMSSLFSRAVLKAVKPSHADCAKFVKTSAVNCRIVKIRKAHDRYLPLVNINQRERERSSLYPSIRSYCTNGRKGIGEPFSGGPDDTIDYNSPYVRSKQELINGGNKMNGETEEFQDKLRELQKEVIKYKSRLDQCEKEVHRMDKKNGELQQALNIYEALYKECRNEVRQKQNEFTNEMVRREAELGSKIAEKQELIVSLKNEMVSIKEYLAIYKFRPRIEMKEMKYMKFIPYTDAELREMVILDVKKVARVTRKILEKYRSLSDDEDTISVSFKREELTSEVVMEEDMVVNVPAAKQIRRHYIRWLFIFLYSNNSKIKIIRDSKTREEIDQLCTDLTELWSIFSAIHYVPPTKFPLTKEEARMSLNTIEFQSDYIEDIVNLLY